MDSPGEAELVALKSQLQHRFPVEARFHVTGDDDADVTLFVLLGNPSGACKMPLGAPVSPSWDAMAAARFNAKYEEPPAEELVADCILWPDQATWAKHVNRWPALPETVRSALRQKLASSLSTVEEPARTAPRPAAVAPLLVKGAVWRQLKPGRRVFDVVIAPPDYGLWNLFTQAMRSLDGKHADTARALAEASLKAVFDEQGAPVATADVLDRWPGQVFLIDMVASALAGLRSDFELGE